MALQLNMNLKLTPEMRQLAIRIGIGLALLVLAAYILVGLPLLAKVKLDAEIATAKLNLARDQKLLPAMSSIFSGAQNATLNDLAPEKHVPTPRAQAYLLTEQLAYMATAAGLEALEVTLNPATMAQDPSTIQAQGLFSGQLEGVRAYLMALSRMPSLARMEKVEVRAVEGHLEMLLQVRISISD